MAEKSHVDGPKKEHKVLLYALSTCGWCKRTKRLLGEMGVDYDYIDVDQLAGEDKDQVRQEVTKWNPSCSFPTIVIDDDKCIAGFREDEMRRLLG